MAGPVPRLSGAGFAYAGGPLLSALRACNPAPASRAGVTSSARAGEGERRWPAVPDAGDGVGAMHGGPPRCRVRASLSLRHRHFVLLRRHGDRREPRTCCQQRRQIQIGIEFREVQPEAGRTDLDDVELRRLCRFQSDAYCVAKSRHRCRCSTARRCSRCGDHNAPTPLSGRSHASAPPAHWPVPDRQRSPCNLS